MADQKVSALTSIPAVDRSADLLYIVDTSLGTSNKVTPNNLLGISGSPVGTTDIQTLTNKTFTAPTITSPVLSGTITGTYTIGGTPTFPSTVVSTTGVQTLTNKTLTSPTINTATISNPTLTVDTVNEHTSANGVTIDGLNIKDSKLNTNNSVVTANITDSAVTHAKVATGMAVQMVYANYSAVATGTTTIPVDDTIPQNTEGDQYMSVAITPKSATNILLIQVTALLSNSAATPYIVGALFQDSTANAIAASVERAAASADTLTFILTYPMVAGTTSSTTFKFRAGASAAGTTTFNGQSAGRFFSTITKSNITVTEYKA